MSLTPSSSKPDLQDLPRPISPFGLGGIHPKNEREEGEGEREIGPMMGVDVEPLEGFDYEGTFEKEGETLTYEDNDFEEKFSELYSNLIPDMGFTNLHFFSTGEDDSPSELDGPPDPEFREEYNFYIPEMYIPLLEMLLHVRDPFPGEPVKKFPSTVSFFISSLFLPSPLSPLPSPLSPLPSSLFPLPLHSPSSQERGGG
jgi:hypothetical protein